MTDIWSSSQVNIPCKDSGISQAAPTSLPAFSPETCQEEGEYFVYVSERILSESREPVYGYLPPHVTSSRATPGWKISGLKKREKFRDYGQVLRPDHRVYHEHRPTKKALAKKALKRAQARQQAQASSRYALRDPRFKSWQQDMSDRIHQGSHIIADVSTSCGKTWAINNIVTHETLQTDMHEDQATAIFVVPRSEILRDSVEDVRANNTKHYQPGTKMLDTQTRSFSTYDEREPPSCQIMFLTADNVESFVTNEVNRKFVSKLKFIVFDEVHMNEVSATMWWASFLPQQAQFILLSATLGNVSEVVQLLKTIAPAHPISVISYHIRPVPLQRILFKGCADPVVGVHCPSLIKAKRLSMQLNQFDPTARDILAIDRSLKLPSTREEQYELGQRVVKSLSAEQLDKNLSTDLADAVVEPSAQNIYRIFSYLYSNGLLPALCFHTTTSKAVELIKSVLSYITQLESNDPDFKRATRTAQALEKVEQRQRDKLAEQTKQLEESGKMWSKPPEEIKLDESELSQRTEMMAHLNKWRFPQTMDYIPSDIPMFIQQALERGIGVYLHNMRARAKRIIYRAYREGKLLLMISDDSLSIGINLPVRTTILCGEDMTPTLYKQMGGRSGRFGYDKMGFILPMFPKPLIKQCLLSASSPQTITVPEQFSYTQLIRLLTPGELGNFYLPTSQLDPTEPAPPGSQFPIFVPGHSPVGTPSALKAYPGPTLKQIILERFKARASSEQMAQTEQWIETITQDQWHYHRLTNLIQLLPHNQTMIVMQLLVNGDLAHITSTELVCLLAVIFQRKPLEAGRMSAQDHLDRPDLVNKVEHYGRCFGFNTSFSQPCSAYFIDFYKQGHYQINDLADIQIIGEWLYILMRQIVKIAPSEANFRQVILQIDHQFMAACKSCDLS